MIRKQARQRRDYLYRKALILKEAETNEKKAQLRSALASGKPLDPSVAREKGLRKDFAYDESRPDLTVHEELDLDDEYSMLSGLVDPSPLVTTSRDPSSRLTAFSKELLPTAVRLNRGNTVLPDLVSTCKNNSRSDIIILTEHRGTPSALTHDIPGSARGTVSESYPQLIFSGFKSVQGKRIVKVLKHLFPPREPINSKASVGSRVVSFICENDTIEVRHHVFVQTSFDSVELSEVGPRMTMKPFEIRGGTLENKDGDVEWHLSQYTRTGRKKDYL
ncbi:U3 small nucleolar ribonucleoprotein IMP4 [Colletotrichum sojae]|uniref:U3 small nucleolar ribonucleoprotein protein IMP4 n=1 Tax=Colletotrichum sojae TaxID=2175907 RepID=A0A8H6MXR9_9PEZI|nr:U3 small nucleolar ribonucleoprotein IMP4 [Colletotrichum sojae]